MCTNMVLIILVICTIFNYPISISIFSIAQLIEHRIGMYNMRIILVAESYAYTKMV